jgi:hypothetical protein
MAKPYLAVLCFLVLTACNSGPAFDVSSQAAYLKSLDAITEKLGAEDERRLDVALLTLALGNTVQSNALQFANSAALKNLVALNGVANPLLFLDRVRTISGRSATGVINLVAADLDEQILRSEAASAGAYKQLGAVVVDHPRYHWDRKRNQPIVEFSVYNGGKGAISRIFVSCVLSVTGRRGNWRTTGASYKFERDLEPGVAVAGDACIACGQCPDRQGVGERLRRRRRGKGQQHRRRRWEKARAYRYRHLGGHAQQERFPARQLT